MLFHCNLSRPFDNRSNAIAINPIEAFEHVSSFFFRRFGVGPDEHKHAHEPVELTQIEPTAQDMMWCPGYQFVRVTGVEPFLDQGIIGSGTSHGEEINRFLLNGIPVGPNPLPQSHPHQNHGTAQNEKIVF